MKLLENMQLNHDGREIPVLPADFVEPGMGTGLGNVSSSTCTKRLPSIDGFEG